MTQTNNILTNESFEITKDSFDSKIIDEKWELFSKLLNENKILKMQLCATTTVYLNLNMETINNFDFNSRDNFFGSLY